MIAWLRYGIGVAFCFVIALPILVLFGFRCIGGFLVRITDYAAVDRAWSNWLFEKAEAVERWASR